jgi:hypothetical protein
MNTHGSAHEGLVAGRAGSDAPDLASRFLASPRHGPSSVRWASTGAGPLQTCRPRT